MDFARLRTGPRDAPERFGKRIHRWERHFLRIRGSHAEDGKRIALSLVPNKPTANSQHQSERGRESDPAYFNPCAHKGSSPRAPADVLPASPVVL